jgi:hypothetical protein
MNVRRIDVRIPAKVAPVIHFTAHRNGGELGIHAIEAAIMLGQRAGAACGFSSGGRAACSDSYSSTIMADRQPVPAHRPQRARS